MMKFDYMSRNVPNPKKYEEIYNLRVKLKSEANEEAKLNGKTEKWKELNAQQNALKLILNTTYGACKNQYNALYDPYQASSLCYLGQLLLASLSNKAYNTIKGIKIIQTNTDGILFKCPNKYMNKLNDLIHEWEAITGFTMEDDIVPMFFQRDVNNYIECTDNPKKPYKLKGKWSNQAEETMANLNAPITHEAILNYYTKNIPIEDTINSCNDPMKFCFTAKTGKNYTKTYHYINNEPRITNKVNRVMATTNMSYGTIKKFKPAGYSENGIWHDNQYDKIGEIPEHCILMNDELYIPETLDRRWYIDFAKNKIKELRWI